MTFDDTDRNQWPRTSGSQRTDCSASVVLGLLLPERTDNHSNNQTIHGAKAHSEGACVRRSQEDQGGMHMTEPTRMDDKAIAELAILEAKREGVEVPYRLVLIRQGEHEKAGRFKEASECCAIRYCLEIVAELSPKESAANAHQQLSVKELTERFYAVKAERDQLQHRIQGCLDSANGRWDEWGERAIDAYKWLVGERGIGAA